MDKNSYCVSQLIHLNGSICFVCSLCCALLISETLNKKSYFFQKLHIYLSTSTFISNSISTKLRILRINNKMYTVCYNMHILFYKLHI